MFTCAVIAMFAMTEIQRNVKKVPNSVDNAHSNEYAIRTSNLVKRYGKFEALSGLDITVKKGEIYGLLGPNGAGKTTAVKIFCGLAQRTSGVVEVLGRPVPSMEVRESIGYMPQETAIYQDLSVHENIELFGQLYGLDGRSIECRERELLEFIDLLKWRDAPVSTLSGGMKHRVSLACSMVHSPELLILDEPTVGVDPQLRSAFWEYFRRLVSKGKTILITTHYMDEAFNCSRVGLMRMGKLIAEGTPEGIVEKNGAKNLEDAFLKLAKGVEA